MDFLKLKLALAQRPEYRFDYNPHGDLKEPRQLGILANERDFEYGMPNLSRDENITLVASSVNEDRSGNETNLSVELAFKWRPAESSNLVTLISKLSLITDKCTYVYDQVETYKPDSLARYGSNSSKLKLLISNPYRRARVVFRGHMRSADLPDETTFVRLNFVFVPTSAIYDFYTQYDLECFRASYEKSNPQRSLKEVIEGLYFHDRHDQQVRLTGELYIENERKIFFAWGFYAREFLEAEKRSVVNTKRLIGYLDNGQVFHIGNNSIEHNQIDFGFTCFEIKAHTKPIEKPSEIDWDLLNEKTTDFEAKIHGQGKSFSYKAVRRSDQSPFFDVNMDGKRGWAWLSLYNHNTQADELTLIGKSRDTLLISLQENRLAINLALDSSTTPLVVSILDQICCCSDLVGAKASSLAQLQTFSSRGGSSYQVPHAFVLTRFAHDCILESNASLLEEINQLEQLIGGGDLSNLRQACERLQKLIEDATFPDILSCELSNTLTSKYSNDLNEPTFAVRSSSWGEDEEDMSAAGQLSTVLGVRGVDSIKKAVLTCLASKFSFENIEYKRLHGLAPSLPMAIVIQEMVECEKAGVLFSCEPTSGNDDLLIITANYGLGESVVSGESEPDSVRVRRKQSGGSTELIIEEISIGQKKVIIDANTLQGAETGNHYDRSKCCLADEEILRLANCALSLVGYFQGQRDIEWGFKGGQLYLFQSRPVTGLEAFSDFELMHEVDFASRAESEFTSRANIGEVLPYAVRPLTFTLSILFWNVSGIRMYTKFTGKQEQFVPQCAYEVLYDSYHAFFRLRCSQLFPMSDGRPKSLLAKSMEVSFFGREIGDQPDIVEASTGIATPPNIFQGWRHNLTTYGLRYMPIKTILKEKTVMRNLRADIRKLKLAKGYDENKMLGLYNQLKSIFQNGVTCWINHIVIIIMTQSTNIGLMAILSNYIKDPIQLFTALAKILATSGDVISAEIPQRLADIARIIHGKGKSELDNFLNLSYEDSLKYLEEEDMVLAKAFETFVEKFGHRCYNEFELSIKSWAEDKRLLVDMVKKNCKSVDVELVGKQSPSLEEVIDSLELDLTFRDKFLLKKVIGPKCQTMVEAREHTKDILIEFSDIQREACRMLAKEMQRCLRIPDADLFYYLFYDEIEPLIKQSQPSIVVQAIRRRNMFAKQFRDPWKFDEIIRGHHLLPNHMKPSKELDVALANAPKLYGTPASSGVVQAKVCLVNGYTDLDKVRQGDILVTHSTDIAFSPVFPLIAGIITEVGGLISHGAVVAREYGLPSVLGIPDVTRILEDKEEILLDADKGAIIRLSKA